MSKQLQIWSNFDGKRIYENGKKKSYWIQTATDEYYDEIVNNMSNGFLLDEPLCRYGEIIKCKKSLDSVRDLFREILTRNSVLLCLTRKQNSQEIQVAGINMTYPSMETDPKYEPMGDRWQVIYKIVDYITKKQDPFKYLRIDTYLSALGLFVLPEFRGEGIGLELLKAREPLSRSIGIKASCTIFTSIISQKIAEKAGFKDLFNISYEELFKKRPDLFIPNIQEHSKNCRYMYIEYK